MKKTKIIIVTGGVFSSLGKGIIAASIGRILVEYGFKVGALKLDPYLNLDPGTMSPYQHGEVFVTSDGGETDLDLGHYERFLNLNVSKTSSISAGKIYDLVLKKERNGFYLGKTIQIVPHVTDEIKNAVLNVLKQNSELDFLLVEVGGTIGDIESLPFVESLRQFKRTYGKQNLLFLHASPLIDLKTASEIKTKPTQHSIMNLRSHGIIPDLLVLRSEKPIDSKIIQKIGYSCDLNDDEVFSCYDKENIYLIPELLYEQKIHEKIFEILNVDYKKQKKTWKNWLSFVQKIKNKKKYKAKIAFVGKYVALPDAYKSIIESFNLSSYEENCDLQFKFIDSEKIDKKTDLNSLFKDCDAICVPYGFGSRGVEGKILTIKYARENQIPFLGICLGMQLACIEFARNVLKIKKANSTEFDPKTKDPIFKIQKDKFADQDLGGTLRLGDYPLKVKKNTLAYKVYKKQNISERHRHRYDFNNDYKNLFEKHGLIFSCYSPKNNVQEIVELKNHPYFIACQFHPEFNSKPLNPNPLFLNLIKIAKKEKSKDE